MKIRSILTLFPIIAFAISSCSIQKRQYMSGYHFDWRSRDVQPGTTAVNAGSSAPQYEDAMPVVPFKKDAKNKPNDSPEQQKTSALPPPVISKEENLNAIPRQEKELKDDPVKEEKKLEPVGTIGLVTCVALVLAGIAGLGMGLLALGIFSLLGAWLLCILFGLISRIRMKNHNGVWRGDARAIWMMAVPLLILGLVFLISSLADGSLVVWIGIGF